MASVPTKRNLYFIVDKLNRSKYVLNGSVMTSSSPVFLPQHPKGWRDIVISFGTNQNYWSLNRFFSVPMQFIGDGAIICREAIYSGKGYEEELYVIILTLNEDTAVSNNFELEYKGRLDFSKHVDEPRKGVTVNTIEAGPLSYLTANESVQYELPLAANNPDGNLIEFDGVNLFDRYRYSVIQQAFVGSGGFIGKRYAMNLPFISNEGDSVGIIQGNELYEEIPGSTAVYVASSANYFFSSIRAVQVRVTGQIKFDVVAGAAPTDSVLQYIEFRTSLDNEYIVLGTDIGGINPDTVVYTSNQTIVLFVDVTINLAADEKLFLIGFTGINGGASHSLTFELTDLFFDFKTINPKSTAYGLSILDVHKQMVLKMTGGRFTGDSVYFSTHKNIQWTSTNALQNFAFQVYYDSFDTQVSGSAYFIKVPGIFKTLPTDNQLVISGATANNGVYTVLNVGALIGGFTLITILEPVTAVVGLSGTISAIPALKVSYKDFFNDVDCLYNIGMKIINDIIYIEPKEDLYKPDVQIFDIGEIANFKLHYADDLLCNTATFGYRSQDYRQRNGIYEYNTTTLFKLPVDTLKKDYTKILKARGDCFGIEFIRSVIFNKPTTDVTGDNQPFLVNTRPGQADVTATVSFVAPDLMIAPLGISFVVGDIIEITGSASNNVIRTVGGVVQTFVGTFIGMAPGGTPFVNEAIVSVFIHWVKSKFLILYRATYTNLAGVLDNTVYNIEEMTPHRMMLKHGNVLRSLLKQLDSLNIVFQTADKNSTLSTTLAGVTIAERQSEAVSSLGDPLFLNRYAEFTTPVPLTFAKIMSNLGTGYVKGTFYGVPIYFLPIGKMDAKPAVNAAQSWKLILAPNNDLEVLKMLSAEGIFTSDSMGNTIFTSDLNSLHFNKYNYSLPAKYQHKEMYDDQFQNRKDQYISQSIYLQPWQNTDAIFIQVITKGIGLVTASVYDGNGKLYLTTPLTIIPDTSVPLPYIRSDYTLNLSAWPEGIYFVVLSAGGVNLRISELLDVRQTHEGTVYIEFSNTTNKYQTYFNGARPTLRVEARLLAWSSDSDFESYTDELADDEVLDGIPYQKRKFRILPIPDWMDNKINKILLLNRTFIEGVRYSRSVGDKKDVKEFQGHDMKTYLYEIRRAKNVHGLSTDETGTNADNLVVLYTLDAKAFGGGDGDIISIETVDE